MYNTFPQSRFLISSRVGAPSVYWCIFDAPASKSNQKILERYITDAQDIFAKKTLSLANFKKTFTSTDEKQLSVMLELLIDARKIWEEEA